MDVDCAFHIFFLHNGVQGKQSLSRLYYYYYHHTIMAFAAATAAFAYSNLTKNIFGDLLALEALPVIDGRLASRVKDVMNSSATTNFNSGNVM